MKPGLLLTIAALCIFHGAGFSQALTPPDITLQPFYNFAVPVGIYNCGDERLFVLEKDSSDIEIVTTSQVYLGKFLDLTGLVATGGERGLLGLAFHPDYASNGFFYVNYTNTAGNTVIARYHVSANPNVADASSASVLLTIMQPYSNHNGGNIMFGPDGYLYIGMGDGGSGGDPQGNSQNPLTLLGKMLRIDVDGGTPYAIPASNPFFGQTDTLPEIWALGLRNPWKFSFDLNSGDMWIGDVGQNLYEEIDFEPAGSPGGSNWGWRCYEGNTGYSTTGCQPAGYYDYPVVVHTHAEGYCSITGGVVYTGENYPALNGIYFYTDYCDGDIMALTPNGSGGFTEANLFAAGFGVVAFGQDSHGEVYVVNNSGAISRLVDTCPFNPQITAGDGTLESETGNAYWWYKDGIIIAGANGQSYTPTTSGSYYAHVSNGTCTRETNAISWLVLSGVGGCTYANATNYNADAQVDDGSCTFSVNCDCPADLNADGLISVSDLILFINVFGTNCYD